MFLAAADEIASCSPQNTKRVNAPVLIKTLIFCGQDGLLHHLRDFLYTDDGSPFLAEFADQMTVSGVYPERNLRAIISQYFERRQVRVG